MEIVINKCHGGFGLSPEANKRLAELKGKKCFFYAYNHSKGSYEVAHPKQSDLFWTAYSTDDLDLINSLKEGSNNWHSMTDKEKDEHNKRYDEIDVYFRDIERTDPKLLQVIKELGEKANGAGAELKIIEIPDDVEWQIEEYDGAEWIAEKHRTWS